MNWLQRPVVFDLRSQLASLAWGTPRAGRRCRPTASGSAAGVGCFTLGGIANLTLLPQRRDRSGFSDVLRLGLRRGQYLIDLALNRFQPGKQRFECRWPLGRPSGASLKNVGFGAGWSSPANFQTPTKNQPGEKCFRRRSTDQRLALIRRRHAAHWTNLPGPVRRPGKRLTPLFSAGSGWPLLARSPAPGACELVVGRGWGQNGLITSFATVGRGLWCALRDLGIGETDREGSCFRPAGWCISKEHHGSPASVTGKRSRQQFFGVCASPGAAQRRGYRTHNVSANRAIVLASEAPGCSSTVRKRSAEAWLESTAFSLGQSPTASLGLAGLNRGDRDQLLGSKHFWAMFLLDRVGIKLYCGRIEAAHIIFRKHHLDREGTWFPAARRGLTGAKASGINEVPRVYKRSRQGGEKKKKLKLISNFTA